MVFSQLELGKLFHSFRSFLLIPFLVFAVPTLNAAPPGSTPPTYYWSEGTGFRVVQTGPTPDIVAQAVVSYYNSQTSWQLENLQPCVVSAPLGGYLCYGDSCMTPGNCTFGVLVQVYPRCGPQSGSQQGVQWDGTEFYCPPEPDCIAH